MAVDIEEIKKEYANRASQSGDKLVRRYVAVTNKLERAASAEAQKNYVAAVTDPAVQARRVQNLKKLSESDLNAAMQATGASAYQNAVSAKADIWANRTQPYLTEFEKVKSTLPSRTRDAMTNLTQRAGAFVKAAVELKKKLG